ncbi:MAG: ComF family protein [Verrucomicrobiota bacterium]
MSPTQTMSQVLRGWLYPPVCAGCDALLSSARQVAVPFLCEECEDSLVRIAEGYCMVCGQSYDAPMSSAFQCANCRDRELGFDFAVSAYRSSGVARELMHQFKYGKRVHLARLMGKLATEVWRDERLGEGIWWMVPVPLHPRRLRSRGFNQAREIALEMRRCAPPGQDCRVISLLRRTRHTVRQAQLDRKERLRNPEGAFALRRELWTRKLKGQERPRFLIVDDVMTTGSTVSECAAVLRKHFDPELIAGVSVMRG